MSPTAEQTERRIRLMQDKLERALQPLHLAIEDESHQHVGHAGARDGRGHFRLTISSEKFVGLSPLQRHRLVYAALDDMMQTDIHALAIEASAP